MFPTLGAHRTTEQNMDWMLSAEPHRNHRIFGIDTLNHTNATNSTRKTIENDGLLTAIAKCSPMLSNLGNATAPLGLVLIKWQANP